MDVILIADHAMRELLDVHVKMYWRAVQFEG